MRSIGIVRRLDRLNRIVIPMEVCKTQGFKENQPLEIYIDNGRIVLQKYTASDEMNKIEQRISYFSHILCDMYNMENCVIKMDFNGVKLYSEINCADKSLNEYCNKKAYNKNNQEDEKIKFTVEALNSYKYQFIYDLPSHKMVFFSNEEITNEQKDKIDDLLRLI